MRNTAVKSQIRLMNLLLFQASVQRWLTYYYSILLIQCRESLQTHTSIAFLDASVGQIQKLIHLEKQQINLKIGCLRRNGDLLTSSSLDLVKLFVNHLLLTVGSVAFAIYVPIDQKPRSLPAPRARRELIPKTIQKLTC